MSKKKLIASALAFTIVAGCKMNLTADVYSTDLRDVAAGTTDLTAPATLALQVPGTDKCDEHTAQISEIMAGVVDDFAPKGCESVKMESFLMADIQMPLLNSEATWKQSNSLFGIIVATNGDNIDARIVLNVDKYEILTNRMKEKFHQTVDLSQSKISLIVNNDERNPVLFSAEAVFVNGEPVLNETDYELKRRHKAEIRFSNVAAAYMAKHGTVGGISMRSQP